MKIKALRGFSYNGAYRTQGSVFDASEKDAKLFFALNMARGVQAEPVHVEPPKPEKRKYRRKDMQAY